MSFARGDDLDFGVERQDRHHRPEDLVAHESHVVGAVGEHGRRHVVAVGQRRIRRPLAPDHVHGR